MKSRHFDHISCHTAKHVNLAKAVGELARARSGGKASGKMSANHSDRGVVMAELSWGGVVIAEPSWEKK